MLVCVHDGFCPDPTAFDSVDEFRAYCIEVFDGVPTLTYNGQTWNLSNGEVVLRPGGDTEEV
jgi:hypothetical protein